MSVPLDDILRALKTYGATGATTAVIAERLNMSPRNLASRLSKKFAYGGAIDRDRHRKVGPNGVGYYYYIWRHK